MPATLDSKLAKLASRQHGNATRSQLLDLGLSSNAIVHRISIGRLHRVFAGVYAVGRPPSAPIQRAAAAVLACGPGALLSHGSAATLWGMDRHWRYPLEVTAGSRRRRAGITVHRSATLAPPDATIHFGIAVTSPARTIFEIAPRLADPALDRAVNDARLARHLHLRDLQELLDRFPWSTSCSPITP